MGTRLDFRQSEVEGSSLRWGGRKTNTLIHVGGKCVQRTAGVATHPCKREREKEREGEGEREGKREAERETDTWREGGRERDRERD